MARNPTSLGPSATHKGWTIHGKRRSWTMEGDVYSRRHQFDKTGNQEEVSRFGNLVRQTRTHGLTPSHPPGGTMNGRNTPTMPTAEAFRMVRELRDANDQLSVWRRLAALSVAGNLGLLTALLVTIFG